MLKVHISKSKIDDAHVQVRKDLKRLLWGKGSVKKSLGVWKMRRVKPGKSSPVLSGKKKGGYKTKVPLGSRCFAVYSEDIILSIECQSESVRDKWVKALEALIKHNKSHHQYATERIVQ